MSGAIAIGICTGHLSQAGCTVAIGNGAGRVLQKINAVAIGACAGAVNQGHGAIAIGHLAGCFSQSNNTIILNASCNPLNGVACQTSSFYVDPIRCATSAKGLFYNPCTREVTYSCAASGGVGNVIVCGSSNVAVRGSNVTMQIGNTSSFKLNAAGDVAIGTNAGLTCQQTCAIAIGTSAGSICQQICAVAIGTSAGQTSQGGAAVAIGRQAGQCSQHGCTVAIGVLAGQSCQGCNSVAIGVRAGQTSQNGDAVAIGARAGQTNQSGDAVAIGRQAGRNCQHGDAVAIGTCAGNQNQGCRAVAIGIYAGCFQQGCGAIAIGPCAAYGAQGASAIAIGVCAGAMCQKNNAIAIGTVAGVQTQGQYAVAIGYGAGNCRQACNTIILNATGCNLNGNACQPNSFYVAPIRTVNCASANILYYDTVTKEITSGPTSSSYGNANVESLLSSGTVTTNIITTANISAANFTTSGVGGDITGANVISGITLTATGNVYGVDVVASYLHGDGSNISNINASNIVGAYGNSNVEALLSSGTVTTDILTTGNVSATGNITANNFITSGSQGNIYGANVISGITLTATGNVYGVDVVASYLHGDGSNISNINASNIVGAYGNANVAAYLDSGTVTTNIITTGNVQATTLVGAIYCIAGQATIFCGCSPNSISIQAMCGSAGLFLQGAGVGQLYTLSCMNIYSCCASINMNIGANTWTFDYNNTFRGTGNVSTSGNIIGGYLYGCGANITGLPASYSNANVATYLASGNVTTNIITTANITANNFTTTGSSGNITGANVISGITLTATGNVYGVDVVASYLHGDGSNISNISANSIIGAYGNSNVEALLSSGTVTTDILTTGNVSATGTINGSKLILDGGSEITFGYGSSIQEDGISHALTVNGGTSLTLETSGVSSGNIDFTTNGGTATYDNTGNLILPNNLNAGGNITAVNYITTGSQGNIYGANVISGVTLTASGNVYGCNVVGTYLYGCGANITGLPAGYSNANVSTYLASGTVTTDIITTANLSAGGNVDGTNLNLASGGGLTSCGPFTVLTPNTSQSCSTGIYVGCGSCGIQLYGAGCTNVLVYAGAAQWTFGFDGQFTAPGNIIGYGNILAPNGSTISTAGNIYGGYLHGDGSNITGGYGNANVTNLLSSGTVSTDIRTTGNIYGNISGNVYDIGGRGVLYICAAQSVVLQSLVTCSTGLTLGNGAILQANGVVNITSTFADVSISPGCTQWLFDQTNTFSGNGTISTSGNIYGGYLHGCGANITGLPAGYSNADVSTYLASGTVTTDYLTTGNISATGSVVGANLYTAGVLSATGNVRGGNINTVGLISAQGNITANNFSTANGGIALGSGVNATHSGFYASPIRCSLTAGATPISLGYCTTTKEIVYGSMGGYGNANVAAYLDSGTVATDYLTTGNVSASGNIYGGYLHGDGSNISNIAVTSMVNGTSNVVVANSGNITITAASSTNTWTFDNNGNLTSNNSSSFLNAAIVNPTRGLLYNPTGSPACVPTGAILFSDPYGSGFITGNPNFTISPSGVVNIPCANIGPTCIHGTVNINCSHDLYINGGMICASFSNIYGGNMLSNNYFYANGSPINTGIVNGTSSVSIAIACGPVAIGVGGSNVFVLCNVNSTFTGNLNPAANATYSLGNSTNQWKSLHVSNTTIYIGCIPISVTNNQLTFNCNPIITANTSGTSTTTGNVSVIGTITATHLYGCGANITGGYSNADVTTLLSSGTVTTDINTTGAIIGHGLSIGPGMCLYYDCGAAFCSGAGIGFYTCRNSGVHMCLYAGKLQVSGEVHATTFYGSAAGLTCIPNVPSANTVGSFGSDMGIGPNYALDNPAVLFSEDDMVIRTGGTSATGSINFGQMDIAASEILNIGLAANLADATNIPSYLSSINFAYGGNTINVIAGTNYLTVDATTGLTYNGAPIAGCGSYGNANVATYLASGNITTNIITTGEITADAGLYTTNISIDAQGAGNNYYIAANFTNTANTILTTGNLVTTSVPADQLKLYGTDQDANIGYPVTFFDDSFVITGYNGNGNDHSLIAPTGNISIVAGLTGNLTNAVLGNTWTFDTNGNLILPTISLGTGLDEQTTIQSQRKLIPPYRWSAVIDGATPTVVYTAIGANTTSMKVTMQVQHLGFGWELFEVFATFTGADTYYVVNNRVAPPTIAATDVVVGLTESNIMEITLTINSGATTSWVTYDAVEFGIPND